MRPSGGLSIRLKLLGTFGPLVVAVVLFQLWYFPARQTEQAREDLSTRARTTARDVPPAIKWEEGMLLTPQHFQGLAQRGEALLHYHSSAVSPFHWGIRHLEVDTVKLVDGLFSVIELEAVMPDGLVVSYSAGDGPDLAVDLTALPDIKQKAAMVHLVVVSRARGLMLAERYTSEQTEPVADENTGEAATGT